MTTIVFYSRSHKRRVLPPAQAAQPLQAYAHARLQAAPELEVLPVVVEADEPWILPAHNPDNLYIPSPLLPPEPTPRTPLRDRLRGRIGQALKDAWQRRPRPLGRRLPDLDPQPQPQIPALAWSWMLR